MSAKPRAAVTEHAQRGVSCACSASETAVGPSSQRSAKVVRTAIALALVAALVGIMKAFHAEQYLLELVSWIRGAGWIGILAFALVYVLATVLFLPGSILTLGAGFAYGVGLGTAVVWIGANLGATVAFLLGRTFAREWVSARVRTNPRFAAIDRAVGREGLKIVLLTRLSPVFPFNLLNYALGLTRVSLRDYVFGSLVGMLPGTVMYVYLGSLITSVSELAAGRTSGGAGQQVFYFGGLAATVAVTLYVTRVARRALADAATDEGDSVTDGVQRELPAVNGASGDSGKPIRRQGQSAAEPGVPLVVPDDEHNRVLVRHVHPRGWVNPEPAGRYNLVVVGAGTAGLVSAAGAAGLGAKVALVERHLMGGDRKSTRLNSSHLA